MSQKMLRKPASELTLAEAALIAGIIRAPASYSPWNHLEDARQRSFVVLQRMREEGKITADQEQAARRERIRIQPPPAVTSAKHGFAKEYLRQQFRNIYGGDNPPDWKVETTFVPEFQDAAEAAVRDGLRRLGAKDLQAALVAMEGTCSRWSAGRISRPRPSTARCARGGSPARRSSRSSTPPPSNTGCRPCR
jgi:membrane peptidoglycan carboxypeptidase